MFANCLLAPLRTLTMCQSARFVVIAETWWRILLQVSGYDFAAPGFKTAQDKAVSVSFHLRRDFRLRRVFLDLSRTFAGYK